MWEDYDNEDSYAPSTQELVREWARQYGEAHKGQMWLLSDWDTWELNPYYTGPAQPHPESYQDEPELTEDEIIERCNAEMDAYWAAEAAADEPYVDPVQADAEVLASAGMGTDEDYGCFEGDDGGWY